MTLQQLEFVLAIYNEGTLTAAAEKLNMSHSGLSRTISNFEAELGFVIFERTRKGSAITKEGLEVLKLAREILGKVEQIRTLSSDSLYSGTLRIRLFPADSMFFLLDALNNFSSLYPNVALDLHHDSISNALKSVRSHNCDYAVLPLGRPDKSILKPLEYRKLLKSHIMIVCKNTSDLAKMDFVTPKDIYKYPMIISTDPIIQNNIAGMLKPYQIQRVLLYTNDSSIVHQMVTSHDAIGFHTHTIARQNPIFREDNDLVLKKIVSTTGAEYVDYVCVYNTSKPLHHVHTRFINALYESLKDHGDCLE